MAGVEQSGWVEKEGVLVGSFEGPYSTLPGDPDWLKQTPGNLMRRSSYYSHPEPKFRLLRVDQVYVIEGNGAERLINEFVMSGMHLIVVPDEENIDPSTPPFSEFQWVIPKRLGLVQAEPTPAELATAAVDPMITAMTAMGGNGFLLEFDFVVHALDTLPNDSRVGELWGMSEIGAPRAWDFTTHAPSAVVGVIDTGIDPTHPDLAPSLWMNPGESGAGKETNGIDDDANGYVDDVWGWDFHGDDNDPSDDRGHGSHCSGTIAASGNNGQGVAGVVWGTQLMALKFLSAQGRGLTSDAVEAVYYATQNGARITNNSWGGGGYSTALHTAIASAGDQGCLFVAAAGNSGLDTDRFPHYPSSLDNSNIISVAAIQQDRTMASFSNYGLNTVDIAAPGVGILSCIPGGQYTAYNGTSMASPHVAGAAALMLAHFPSIEPWKVKELIMNKAKPVPSMIGKSQTGGGLDLRLIFDTVAYDPTPISASPSLSAGDHHVVKLNADGTVTQWGAGHLIPELKPFFGGVTQVSTGNLLGQRKALTVVLKQDGTVWYWEVYDSPIHILGMEAIVEISLGTTQLIARKADGTVWTWGTSFISGALGDGSSTTTTVGIQVSGISGAVALAAGETHNLVLLDNGTVMSWGKNTKGQLGDGTTVDRLVPVSVSGLSNVKSIAAGFGPGGDVNVFGGNQSFAVLDDGTVWSWGYNRNGELGQPYPWISTPAPIAGASGIREMVAGTLASYAIGEDGKAYSVGWNGSDYLTEVPNLQGVVQLAAGHGFAVVLLDDGSVWGWGKPQFGQIGNALDSDRTYRPVDPGLSDIVTIGANYDASTFIDSTGHVWEAGSSSNSDFTSYGPGAFTTLFNPRRTSYGNVRFAPARAANLQYELLTNGIVRFAGHATVVPNLSNAVQLATFDWSGGAVRSDGALLTWSQSTLGNSDGQLGDGTTTPRTDARVVAGLPTMSFVAVSYNHMVASGTSGDVYCWGSGTSGQLGNGSNTPSLAPVQVQGLPGTLVTKTAAGGGFSLALTSNGKVYGWGSSSRNGTNQSRNTAGLVNFPEIIVDIAANHQFALAVGQSGAVYAWGENEYCQLGTGTTTDVRIPTRVSLITTAVKVAAGGAHGVALLADGSVRCWGRNQSGQIGNGRSLIETPIQIIDATGSTGDQTTLDFAAPPSNNWYSQYFSEAELLVQEISGLLADPDHDGLANIVEYSLGTNPRVSDAADSPIVPSLVPVPDGGGVENNGTLEDSSGPCYLTIEIRRSSVRNDTRLTVEVSRDLHVWEGVTEGAVVKELETTQILRFRATSSIEEDSRMFARVRVDTRE